MPRSGPKADSNGSPPALQCAACCCLVSLTARSLPSVISVVNWITPSPLLLENKHCERTSCLTKKKAEFNQKLPADESREEYTRKHCKMVASLEHMQYMLTKQWYWHVCPRQRWIFSLYFCFMSMVVCLHACLCTMCVQRPEESIRSPASCLVSAGN